MSADMPEPNAAPQSPSPKRPQAASLATGLLVGSGVALALLLLLAPPLVSVIAALPCCMVGAAGCLLMSRLHLSGPRGAEPWRLDAWALGVGGASLLALGLSVGPEAKLLGWLLVALIVSLTLAGVGTERPQR